MSRVTVLFVFAFFAFITASLPVGLKAQGHGKNRQHDHSKGEKKSREPESFAATPGFIRLLIRRHITIFFSVQQEKLRNGKWQLVSKTVNGRCVLQKPTTTIYVCICFRSHTITAIKNIIDANNAFKKLAKPPMRFSLSGYWQGKSLVSRVYKVREIEHSREFMN